jgi:hypothetical protein
MSEKSANVCGNPSENHTRAYGEDRKSCPECRKIEKKLGTCLSCGVKFEKGCRSKHVCGECLFYNSGKDNYVW